MYFCLFFILAIFFSFKKLWIFYDIAEQDYIKMLNLACSYYIKVQYFIILILILEKENISRSIQGTWAIIY